MCTTVFDKAARIYDSWYESNRGSAIFRAELNCIRRLLPSERSEWLEVGTGTGRFAAGLNIPAGVEPSPNMRRIAAGRDIDVQDGTAEQLPCESSSLNGVLMVVTLCFLDDVHQALDEIGRVLRPHGALLVGMIPADSPWGQHYQHRAKSGHRFYSAATFRTRAEVQDIASDHGFELDSEACTLQSSPEQESIDRTVSEGYNADCGFVALLFRNLGSYTS